MTEFPVPLLEGLTGRQRDQALHLFEQVTVHHGTPLMVEGDVDPSLLYVLDGELEIRTGDVDLWTAKPGEMVGEIGLFTEGVRTATVETNTEATLLILTREGYEELVERDNPVAMRIEEFALAALVQRLRAVDVRIAELAQGTELADVTPPKSWFDRVTALFGAGGQRATPKIDIVKALAGSRLFEGVYSGTLEGVASVFQPEAWGPGEFLCTEGERGEDMYMVVSGLVDVLVATQGERVEPVATLDEGDIFGMAGLVDNRPRSATCITRDEVVVLRLDRTGWARTVGRADPAGRVLRVAMIRSLAEQLAFANGQLALVELTTKAQDLTPLKLAAAGIEVAGRGLGG